MKHINIAIDGPSGAGKSTIARMVASNLGIVYVDTGAMYRCIGLYMVRNNITETEDIIEALSGICITIAYKDELQRMYLNGEDVTEFIRTPEISSAASQVSAIPQVRSFLLDMQRDLARENSVIMDGRDIGTVVLPDADLKIFLTATAEDRALRRLKEYSEKGMTSVYEDVLLAIKERDKHDSERDIAPLKPAEDSIILDTTGNTLMESYNLILDIVRGSMQEEQ